MSFYIRRKFLLCEDVSFITVTRYVKPMLSSESPGVILIEDLDELNRFSEV